MYKVGDKLICLCDGWEWLGIEKDSIWQVSKTFQNPQVIKLCKYANETKTVKVFTWNYEVFPNDFALYKEKEMLDKNTEYFINVAAYAKEHNITLKQAHEEIQPWLFEQEYIWALYQDAVMFTYADYLEINYEHSGIITWAGKVEDVADAAEIILERVVKTEINLIPTIIEEEFVEFNGKQYSKAKLEQALKLIEESK